MADQRTRIYHDVPRERPSFEGGFGVLSRRRSAPVALTTSAMRQHDINQSRAHDNRLYLQHMQRRHARRIQAASSNLDFNIFSSVDDHVSSYFVGMSPMERFEASAHSSIHSNESQVTSNGQITGVVDSNGGQLRRRGNVHQEHDLAGIGAQFDQGS